jgi:four helix bundle protein
MKNIVKEKSYSFAIEIVRMTQILIDNKKEFVLSKQILKSGTAIGALIRESEFAASRADFINKLTISLKEANETEYWLLLLRETDYISDEIFSRLQSNCNELISILIASIKTAKKWREE